jgi:lysyl-tRNA synthetase class 2
VSAFHRLGPRIYLPAVAAAAAFAVGVVNLASALTPNVAWRHHLLLRLEPVEVVPVFHTLAVPLSVALIVVAFYLRGRRRRAWQLALALLIVLGVVALLKGLDFEEAILSWSAAALLWWGRGAFCVRHRPLGPFSPVLVVVAAVAAASGGLLAWNASALEVHDELEWLPALVGTAGLAGVLVLTYVLFRPLGAPRELPGSTERRAAVDLVRRHGHDTLAFFKLRQDAHYRFNHDHSAFLGYRVANGVMLVAGDPIGAHGKLAGLVSETCAFAASRGLRVAALGASPNLVALYRQAGFRSLYLGDEAIVDTRSFSLEGRSIRKVRQSVSRAETAGYHAELLDHDRLDERTIEDLEHVSERWRDGAPERGFSMAMDSLRGGHQAASAIVAARDGDGRIRAFIHFVPVYGRPAMSLSFMRRDRDTPNGLMEFVVVRAIQLLGERGVEEVSLNFAAFARWLSAPAGRCERALGRAVSLANPYFQIESLLSFNAKFGPRWEPRYLVYERKRWLPRVGLAALRIEGQLPKPWA